MAIAKVETPLVGHTLVADNKSQLEYPKVKFPVPMVSLAVQPKSRADEQKINVSLNKMAEEDPAFVVDRNEETHEIVVSGMSNLHLTIMLNRMKNRFKVECTSNVPKIAYRETITAKGKHVIATRNKQVDMDNLQR